MQLSEEMQKYKNIVLNESGSVAAKVAAAKEKNPDLFCPVKKCLWRTGGGYCPRHTSAQPVKEGDESLIDNVLKGVTRGMNNPFSKKTTLPDTCTSCGTPNSATAGVHGGICFKCRKAAKYTPEQKKKDELLAGKKYRNTITAKAREDAFKCWFEGLPKERQEAILKKQQEAVKREMDSYMDPKHRFESVSSKKKVVEGFTAKPVSHSQGITWHVWQDGPKTIRMKVYDVPRGGVVARVSAHYDTGGDESPMPEEKNFKSYEAARHFLKKQYGI